ncbi:short transient receptor potential channel 7-like [Ptychodera flava]|uniref:short transient receptor potential channel 7-like n=1 Tax=Ptychodera flava TaxID=63121 RepID=UPI00396AA66E
MQAFYLSALIGKMFLIFLEMRAEVFRFLVIFGYVVLVFASAFYFLYHRMRSGIFRPFSTFNSSLLHLTMTMFSGGGHIEFLQLLNHNVTRVNALSNGTHVIDNSNIYDIIGFTLYMVFLTMAIFILLKLCGAMMTNKYSILDERIVREWYFKRSEIWLLFIRQKIIFPPPHNKLEIIFRTLLGLKRCIQSALYRRCKIDTNRKDEERIQMADGREDFIPSYEQLITILKIRYYREYGRKNCRIHGLCEDKTHV